MGRRDKQAGKTQRPKALKRRNAPKAARRRSSLAASKETSVARLTRERDEALQQQTAISEVLSVINSSPGDLKPVFEAMLENAVRLCEAKFGFMTRYDGDAFNVMAHVGATPAYVKFVQRGPLRTGPETILGQVLSLKQAVQIPDMLATRGYAERNPLMVAAVELGGVRTYLAVPMLKENKIIGAVLLYRQEVRPFSDKQVALLTSFAAQAVIAIENARLLAELRQRTDDLSKSLEQQTATSEVLEVISRSPGDLEPVFAAVLAKAVSICQASFGNIYRWDGEGLHLVAAYNTPPALIENRKRSPYRPSAISPFSRAIATKSAVHVLDAATEPAYLEERHPGMVASVDLGGIRTYVAVPLLKEDELIGLFTVFRQEVLPFTNNQISLLQNFAAQAVIAIENTRLLNELRESLQQQTATADVLKVISSSPGELQPVFDTMLENAVKICDAKFGLLYPYENGHFRPAAGFGVPPALAEFLHKRGVFQPPQGSTLDHLTQTKEIIVCTDVLTQYPENPTAKFGGARTYVAIPMLKERELAGTIIIYRQEVRPFTEKQIELLTNFAAQAVIAIENARLLNELRLRTDDLTESLEQQTATSQVLQVISTSRGDLEPVLASLLENAVRICDAKFGNISRWDGDGLYLVAAHNTPSAFVEYRMRSPYRPSSSPMGRALATKTVVHVADAAAEPTYLEQREPGMVAAVDLGGIRTWVAVPLLKESELIGLLTVYRQEVRPFSDKQIELLKNFAAQAVIAIENTRLLNELRQSTADLTRSLEDLRTAQDRLVQTEKLASLGQLTAGIAHEIKNPLNFVNNFSAVSSEMIYELQEALKDVSLNEKKRNEITELMDTLRGNLDKVVQHGKRADSIVKNMLLHSRQGSGEHRPVDINAVVEESLNLAYHGARAEKQGFNITLEKSFDPAAGEVDVFPQEIARVLLNLISNGFYAATKRQAEGNGIDYEPTLAAATKSLGGSVEIRIRDNGTGIPPEVKDKMFNPFFTTKPAGEGTGLGLSISHDIIVKQHGGSIEVNTQPGEFTEFRIVLPRGTATIAKSGERA